MSNNFSIKTGYALLLIFLFSSWISEATIVRYIDVYGKAHYVNTKYSKVPERYLDQVQDQLEEETPELVEAEPQKQENDTFTPADVGVKVEVFTAGKNEDCRKLEILLKAFKITYTKYDINETDYGREVFSSVGGKLPFTKVGGKIFHGYKIRDIEKELKKHN
ncbi:MAG: hypothetical protein KAR05_06675 [Candidatus Omnitrophica bacterium]|nr:hypothetical protein [Candidatus Omnitrophota bacterium]